MGEIIITAVLFLIPILLFVLWKLYKINQYWSDQGVQDVKPAWPIVGNALQFATGTNYGEWVLGLYNKYEGRYLGIYQFMDPVLLLKDPELIKNVTIKDFDSFVDHNNFFTASKEPVFRENLFSLKGEPWRQMRATLSPAFTSSKMRIMFKLMQECAEKFAQYFIDSAASTPDQLIILNTKDAFSRVANDVIATCAFGVTCDSVRQRDNEFYRRGQDVGHFTGARAIKFFLFTWFPSIMNSLPFTLYSKDLITFFRKMVDTTVGVREKQNIYRPDMIHLLMQARKGELKYVENVGDKKDTGFATTEESIYGTDAKNAKTNISNDEFAAQILLFLLAGFETTSTVLSFMSYELAKDEEIQRRLQKEIDAYMEECQGNITYENVLRLKYLDMVVSETLRLWPPVFVINRVCAKPYTIPAVNPGETDIVLKPNDVVWVAPYATQRDPNNYPNPNKFDPERFSDENKHNINPYTFLPFGMGPRNCIGSRFALLEIKVVTVYMLSKFDIIMVNDTSVPPKIHKKAFLLNTYDGITLGFKLRNK